MHIEYGQITESGTHGELTAKKVNTMICVIFWHNPREDIPAILQLYIKTLVFSAKHSKTRAFYLTFLVFTSSFCTRFIITLLRHFKYCLNNASQCFRNLKYNNFHTFYLLILPKKQTKSRYAHQYYSFYHRDKSNGKA